MNKILQHIRASVKIGALAVFHTTTGARFEVGRGLSGGYHAEWYGRGFVLIASHRELTLREAASLVLRWEAEDEINN